MRTAAHPGLYDPDVEPPMLHATRCAACGTVFFPPLSIGCEVCGALARALEPTDLAATGTIHSVATVHVHQGDDIQAPFTMAEIQLDGGPLIRATMTQVVEPDVIGRRAQARFVPARAGGDPELVEPRFEVVPA